jgi:hypothetical protein
VTPPLSLATASVYVSVSVAREGTSLSTKRLIESASPRQLSFLVPLRVAFPPSAGAAVTAAVALLAGVAATALAAAGVELVPPTLRIMIARTRTHAQHVPKWL